MSLFGAYSQYYDLLYKEKDYVGEAHYVESLIKQHHAGARSLLDLGCGTGRHALLLAQSGYTIVGVDRSSDMLSSAKSQTALAIGYDPASSFAAGTMPEFLQGDLRTVRVGRKFDVVTALFHVMSYQTANADLLSAFETAKAHLEPGGIFIFDCWYGPAVLTVRPSARVRQLENDQLLVTRNADPVSRPNENCVDVNYDVSIRDKRTGLVEELKETHAMRYLFSPEVELYLELSGLRLKSSAEFMTNRQLGLDTWSAVFVATLAE